MAWEPGQAVVVRRWAAAAVAATVMAVCAKAGCEGLTLVPRPAIAAHLSREQQVMDAAGIDDWPQSKHVTGAPSVDRSMLSRLDLVTQEDRSFSVVELDNTECGMLWIKWRHVAASDAPPPTELPADMREALDKLPKDMSPEDRQRLHDKWLKRYRESKASVILGEMEIKIVAAGSSRAAHEWLIFDGTQCSLPTKAVADQFSKNKRVASLGDVAFKSGNVTVRLVRGNIAVVVRATGDFAAETEKIAAKIDAAIAKEATFASLKDIRPRIAAEPVRTARSIPESSGAYGQKACPFTVTDAKGQTIAHARATVNGEYAAVKDNQVLLGSAKGQLEIKISAITDRLVVSSVTKTARVDGK